MPEKRARERPSVDVSLIEVFEDLTHEVELIRVKAASTLVKGHFLEGDTDHQKTILKRLFRGLCSGRKAARLGFSIALTECLSQLKTTKERISSSDILDILENNTIPESDTSGQDERDHFFGRLFGIDAVILSGLLYNEPDLSSWLRLLDILCGVAVKKPWLRQQCGHVLVECITRFANFAAPQSFLISIAEKLVQHKLARTPEGLSIWIILQDQVNIEKLPKHVWKHHDPLVKQDLQALAQVLKDAKCTAREDSDYQPQGGAVWSAQIHFAWGLVMEETYSSTNKDNRVGFGDFWLVAVDEGLFAPANSSERKHWGFQLFQHALLAAPTELLSHCFTNNATNCLMQSLKSEDRYLQKGAQKILQTLLIRAKQDNESVGILIFALMKATSYIDFDVATKTKTVDRMLSLISDRSLHRLLEALEVSLRQPSATTEAVASNQRKNIINLQRKLFSNAVNNHSAISSSANLVGPHRILQVWIDLLNNETTVGISQPPISVVTKGVLRQGLSAALERLLKIGSPGRLLALESIASMKKWSLSADQQILDILTTGWQRYRKHYKVVRNDSLKSQSDEQLACKGKVSGHNHIGQPQSQTEVAEGLALLYGLIIFQAYGDEPEAISILEELMAFEDDTAQSTKAKGLRLKNADGLIDILLSFASQPSKFLRRITLDVFEAFTSHISRDGLQTLVNVLGAKESKAGQEELFDAEADMVEDGQEEGSENSSDVEMIDSDVELVDLEDHSDNNSTASTSPSSEANSDSESESSAGPGEDELAALEKSLAAALGTRKITMDDLQHGDEHVDSDSDSDMDDDQMMSLDEKLSEVFRTRAAAQSQSKSRQKENKVAKENMTNFKNRVLDMLDVYLKQESHQNHALELVLPLLRLARETTVKQISTRSIELIKSFCTRCKGLQNIITLKQSHNPEPSTKRKKSNHTDESAPQPNGATQDFHNATDWAMGILASIHEEVCLPSSNTHKSACSQSSLLLAKTLIFNGVDIRTVIDRYSRTQTRMMLEDKIIMQEAFFRDWIGWCGSVKGSLGKNTHSLKQ